MPFTQGAGFLRKFAAPAPTSAAIRNPGHWNITPAESCMSPMSAVWPVHGVLNICTATIKVLLSWNCIYPPVGALHSCCEETEGDVLQCDKAFSIMTSDAFWQSWWWAGMLKCHIARTTCRQSELCNRSQGMRDSNLEPFHTLRQDPSF